MPSFPVVVEVRGVPMYDLRAVLSVAPAQTVRAAVAVDFATDERPTQELLRRLSATWPHDFADCAIDAAAARIWIGEFRPSLLTPAA